MKFIKELTFLSIIILLTACGGKKESDNQNLTPLQQQAVTYVKKHLDKGTKLISSSVIEEPMPASIMEQPFQNLRNVVFKAGLDYETCKKRNLEQGMVMAEDKIQAAQESILATEKLLQQNIGETKSLIVLAEIKTPKSVTGNNHSLIVVFDPETMEAKEWIPVTTPVQNTVALVACAQDNTLAEYAKEQNHETKILASKVSDPVLKFVLEANAM